ncbi:MAG TPA: DUF6148 family protein [Syntrophales bacterium]|nr:DUF6148 family protein [Syntrophales bacterium]HNS53342.1 DUF6148 family protein [Syntrophales bacterium]
MAGITLAQAEAQLALWIAADTAVATGQSYSVGGRQLTRADAAEIRNNIIFWDSQVRKLSSSETSGGRIIIRGGTPV